MNWRQIKWLGGVAGALMAIIGLITAAVPAAKAVLASELPSAGLTHVAQLGAQVQTLQQGNERILNRLDQAEARNDQRDLEWYQFQLKLAQDDAGPRPNRTVQQTIQALKDRVNAIRFRLKLPPIQ